MRLVFAALLCLAPLSAQAGQVRVVANGTLNLGGNDIAQPYMFERSGDSLFVNNLRLWPRVVPVVKHAPVTSLEERKHNLFVTVFSHPAWTIERKLAVFTSAADLVARAWADPGGERLWVVFTGEPQAQSVDLTPSQADPIDSALNQRLETIIACLEEGGGVYFGSDYITYVDRAQLPATKAQLSQRATASKPMHDAFEGKFAQVIRDRRSPLPLSLYRR